MGILTPDELVGLHDQDEDTLKLKLPNAITKANRMIESWTEEELKQYAFDRLVTELLKE